MPQFTALKTDFLLDPEVIFLNHGSFGATPRPVFKAYQRWQKELEFQPVAFLGRQADDLLYQSRRELATFLNADPLDLVYTSNATQGVNVFARSLDLQPEDIVLTTNHEYGAMDRTWRFLATQKGFIYQSVQIPVPVPQGTELLKLFEDHLSPRVRVLYLSHIASPTALIFPVQDLCALAHRHGILTIIDGAHAPGQIPLDLSLLGADFYTGNLHKWLCAPKGSAFIWAEKSHQTLLKPLVVSWGYESENPSDSQFIDLFQWTGTRDISPFLTVPDAINYRQQNHWEDISSLCHQKAAIAEREISAITGQPSLYSSDLQFGQMFSVQLPDGIDIAELKSRLYDSFHIEVPVIHWNQRNLMRVSLQAYNSDEDVSALEDALKLLLQR